MNMSSVLHRRSHPDAAVRPAHWPSAAPPPPPGTGEGAGGPLPWPTGAKVLIAILIVATVFGTIGLALAAASTDDGSVERGLQSRVDSLTVQRDDALADVAALDAELATLRQQLQSARDGNDELTGRIAALDAEIDAVTAQRAEALATADRLTSAVADLEATVDTLEAGLATANQRAVAAIAERDALAELFPTDFDASLVDIDLTGTHDVDIAQVHCAGLSSCGKAPAIADLTIRRTSEGALWLVIPGYVEGGFSRTGGALHMIAHSTTAVPKCDGVARQAEVTLTLFPGSYRIADDGARTVTSVDGVMTVDVPATDGCPAALAYYSVQLS